jgi:hypothetical protein
VRARKRALIRFGREFLLIAGSDRVACFGNPAFGRNQTSCKSFCTESPVKPLELPEGPIGDEPGQ